MSNASIRRLIAGVGTGLILLICAVVIVAHFLTGANLQRIDVSEYTEIRPDGNGGYTATLNVDRLISAEHLYRPAEEELRDYPEIAALRSLAIRMTQRGDAYELETVTRETDPTQLLKEHGIRLSPPRMKDLTSRSMSARTAERTAHIPLSWTTAPC